MSDQDVEVDVIFRRWRASFGRGIIAIFPEIDAGNGGVLMYEHVGQHGGGSYQVVISKTKPVRYDDLDVLELKRELEGRGYHLKPRYRVNGRTMRSLR